jgi:hypothetical protein
MTNFQRLSIPDSFNLRTISKSKDNFETICYIFPMLPRQRNRHFLVQARIVHRSCICAGLFSARPRLKRCLATYPATTLLQFKSCGE